VPDDTGTVHRVGVAPNELTRGADRDRLAGPPRHEDTPARVVAL
jgi:hypothetical protein